MEILNRTEEIQQIKEKLLGLEAQQTTNRRLVRLALEAGSVSDIQALSLKIKDMRRKPGGLRELNKRIHHLYYSQS